MEEELLGSLVGIHGAFPEHCVYLLVSVAPGDLLDVLDRPPDAVGDGNPRRTAGHLGSQWGGNGEGVASKSGRGKREDFGGFEMFLKGGMMEIMREDQEPTP